MTARLPALILTAGLGTRLDPLTRVRAKPAVPVGGEPIVRRVIRWLVAQDVTDITCNLHHLPQTLTQVLGDGSDLNARIRYSWEGAQVLGSGGGPRQALDILGSRRFFIVNGDTLTDADLHGVAASHERSGALVTMALIPNDAPQRYGGVRLDADGAVVGFVRKGDPTPSFHFVGVQLAEATVFAGLAEGRVASTVGGVYDALIAARPGAVRGCHVQASFHDVGTIEDYWRTSHTFDDLRPPSDDVNIAPSADVATSILWNRVSVGANARLSRCIVTDSVHVPAGASYTDAVLLREPGGQVLAIPFNSHDGPSLSN